MKKIIPQMQAILICLFVFAGLITAQSNFKADQLQMVKYSDGRIDGSFEKTIGNNWKETNSKDGTHIFAETNRDDWSVYLKDQSRNITIQIDLHQKSIFVDPFGTERRKIYSITKSVAKTLPLVLGKTYSFESFNFPGEYMRHKEFKGIKSKVNVEEERTAATYLAVKGLVGNKCGSDLSVSFEAINYAGYYLRHQNSRLIISLPETNDLFKNDATFCLRHGLADAKYSSLESVNIKNFFITHINGELWIRKGTDKLFKEDATFLVRFPLYYPE
jgi:hypothetical protein